MTRYVPTPEQQTAIELLQAAGYAVVRQRTYGRLLERVRVAECRRGMEVERRESTEQWAHSALDEQRRLCDRLTDVAAAAAAQGVTITAINAALHPEPQT